MLARRRGSRQDSGDRLPGGQDRQGAHLGTRPAGGPGAGRTAAADYQRAPLETLFSLLDDSYLGGA